MNIIVIAGSGGLGRAFVEALAARPEVRSIIATHRRDNPTVQRDHATQGQASAVGLSEKCRWHQLDATQEAQVAAFAEQCQEIDWLINAAGMLHQGEYLPEKRIAQLDPEFALENFRTNTLPTMLLARHLLPKMRHGRPAVFASISARLASIGENGIGGWYSYRASKAALNQVIRTLSIECRRTHPQLSLAALHPGTTDTALSKPFQRNVPDGQLFTPEYSVASMLKVLDRLTPETSGRFWSFDGTELPW
ncbi:NAD(P)-dependent dehydrogenase, short-chain alcohol dehydrogenase family [Ectothiorhodosinus mongolicus]|uniref:NAD(P)-dependent dehydrogenase, short-chain alcohol dehydrogenase family n=1 Tax=Ectothiorhodosinus mongolicus TaxID=233100 RepID=A0A1R3VQ87_9GAMM|nr:SDR family NAD(P)-dependent oxidoreductase [Ectothiorhodosinus mongolicus]ULX57847.1 short chain dehydrogenase [Ectothiorhodosinus mongolicus]SIT65723.1 NAD(P)-dependent dehydrogenase, short-chain alcohol dehydrogenase family [Ectothiorhodosinus mongolicus]